MATVDYIGTVTIGGNDMAIGSTLFGFSSTAAASATKIAAIDGFSALVPGITVHIKFIEGNSVTTNMTLQVGTTTACPISGTFICEANSVVAFTLDDNGTGVNKTWRVNQSGLTTDVKTYIDTAIANSATPDALVFKGTLGTSGTVTVLPSVYEIGWTYKVITAGTYAGNRCEIGDLITAIVACSASDTPSDSNWVVIQGNLDGTVVGPASATATHIATFTDGTGKAIGDSGYTIGTSVPANAVFTDTTYTTSTSAVYNGCSASNDNGATAIASVSNGVLTISGIAFTTTNVVSSLTASTASPT